ncbi:hypothetical protein [Paenibacillus sp. FSL E2-0178]|uniref:hypothetical protein n=1 Tax=Paenibacillus sp. FSL E2-0178 TaxID=2921361 RepID=UPI0031583F1D
MDTHKKPPDGEEQDREDLITERDIDEESGLFQEGTYPGALPDKDQKAAVNHAVPKEGQT